MDEQDVFTRLGVGGGVMGSASPNPPPVPASRSSSTSHSWRRFNARVRESRLRCSAARGRLDASVEPTPDRVTFSTDFDALQGCQAACEAFIEDAKAKGMLFRRGRRTPRCPLSLLEHLLSPIAAIASWTQRPECVLGIHSSPRSRL